MSAFVRLVFEVVAHQAALLPLATLLYLTMRHRKEYGITWWLIAAGLAVSWIADTMTRMIDWRLMTYLYPPFQFGLIYLALLRRHPYILLKILSGMTLLALISLAYGPLNAPEVPTQMVASILVVMFIWNRSDLGLIREGLCVYFGLGLILWATCAFTVAAPDVFLLAWFGYQIARLVGLTLVTTAVAKHGLHT